MKPYIYFLILHLSASFFFALLPESFFNGLFSFFSILNYPILLFSPFLIELRNIYPDIAFLLIPLNSFLAGGLFFLVRFIYFKYNIKNKP